jgi:hypothetical protein
VSAIHAASRGGRNAQAHTQSKRDRGYAAVLWAARAPLSAAAKPITAGQLTTPITALFLVTRRFTRSGLAAGRSFLTFRADTAAGHHLDTIRSLWSGLLLWGCLSFFWGDAAMWNFRFAAHHVVSAFFCLIFISGAHAQTAAEATGDKRVQVLEIRDPSAPGESLVNKPKAASKKKVAIRKSHGEVKAAASEGAPKIPVQSTMASVAPANPVGNDALPQSWVLTLR